MKWTQKRSYKPPSYTFQFTHTHTSHMKSEWQFSTENQHTAKVERPFLLFHSIIIIIKCFYGVFALYSRSVVAKLHNIMQFILFWFGFHIVPKKKSFLNGELG